MKLLALGMMSVALLFAGTNLAAQKAQSYTGEIMDSACAKTGSHDAMMKKDPTMKTAKDCTLGCVQHGAKYVLYDTAAKTAYDLDDQQKAERFAGEKVTISGTLDNATHTLKVGTIKAAATNTSPKSY